MSYFDDWETVSGRQFIKKTGRHQINISPDMDGYALSVSHLDEVDNVPPDLFWLANTLEGLEGPARFLSSYLINIELLTKRPEITKTTELDNGWTITALRKKDGRFSVTVENTERETVGVYFGFLNTAIPSFVMNEITIQGSEHLHDEARGMGLGDRMRDAAEEIMELRAVPHGRNHTMGTLSEAAAKSWEKRATKKTVPGMTFDTNQNIRSKFLEKINERKKESLEVENMTAAIKISERTGCDIVACYYQSEPFSGWVITETGVPIHPSGIIDENALIKLTEMDLPSFGTNDLEELIFVRHNVEEARTLMEHEKNRLPMRKSTSDFVERMVARIKSGNLPKPITKPAICGVPQTSRGMIS